MKKNAIKFMLGLTMVLVMASCGSDDSPAPQDDNNTNNDPPVKTKTEMLAKVWVVDEAYVNGTTPDNSSKGLVLDIKADGTYKLVSTGYDGTWEFEENETKINFDKNSSQFNQVFTLQEFTDTKIDATFVSAFTGQQARWVMIPKN